MILIVGSLLLVLHAPDPFAHGWIRATKHGVKISAIELPGVDANEVVESELTLEGCVFRLLCRAWQTNNGGEQARGRGCVRGLAWEYVH